MNKIKTEKNLTGYQMVLFDVKSLFTSTPLDHTIDTYYKEYLIIKKFKQQWHRKN